MKLRIEYEPHQTIHKRTMLKEKVRIVESRRRTGRTVQIQFQYTFLYAAAAATASTTVAFRL